MIKDIKRKIRNFINDFTRSESVVESKKKWNELAVEEARYYIMSDFGRGIDEDKFVNSGKNDYKRLIVDDELLQEKLQPFVDKKVLEIGCGIGRVSQFIADEFKEVIGLDISDKMIEMGNKRLSKVKNIKLIATDGRTYPVEDGSVDLVFSFIVFQHMADRETIRKNFEEASRVLKHNGIMKVQLRGVPTIKKEWFYGPSFDMGQVKKIIKGLPLSIIKTEGENQMYFWLWLKKHISD